MTTANKQFNINFNTSDVLGLDGEILMTQPSISYQSQPNFELHFVDIDAAGNLNPVDVSDAVSWSSALDVDFNDETEPMVRTLPSSVITSGAASGIVIFPLDANTTTFHDKINGRQSLQCWVEFRGRNSDDKIIYDYKFRIAALGAIDGTEGTPLPPVSGSVTIADVYALLRSATEFRFSADGTNWHSQQTTGDVYYESRYPQGEWSEPIEIVKGTDGEDGHNVQFEYSENGSSWHTTPTANDKYFRTSNDGGTTWTNGLLFKGADGQDGVNGVGFELLGEYSDATTYNPPSLGTYECVYYNGSTYAYINSSASSGHTPPDAVSDSYWLKIANKGSVDNITVSDITDFNTVMSGILSGYAQKSDTYSISQIDLLLNNKANVSDVYSTAEADMKFIDTDELSSALNNRVTLTQWSNQNNVIQGEIDYLSGQISGGGDLSAYTPLSATQSISGTLQNEISTLSTAVENLPSSSIEGVNLNNERALTVSNVAWVLAMPMRTTMPNANDTDQDFMFYVGDTNATYTKAHLYERVADTSATPPSEDDITISIPDYNIYNVTLTKGGDGAWTGTSQQGQVIRIAYYQGDPSVRCKNTYGISINGTVEIMGVNEVSDELPWQVYPWEIIQTETTTPVTMSHVPHGGSGARTYHWEDISPWASNS